MNKIMERMREVFKEIINAPIDKNTTLASLHLDSLDLTELVEKLEFEFSIQIEDNFALTVETVGKLAEYIGGKVSK